MTDQLPEPVGKILSTPESRIEMLKHECAKLDESFADIRKILLSLDIQDGILIRPISEMDEQEIMALARTVFGIVGRG